MSCITYLEFLDKEDREMICEYEMCREVATMVITIINSSGTELYYYCNKHATLYYSRLTLDSNLSQAIKENRQP